MINRAAVILKYKDLMLLHKWFEVQWHTVLIEPVEEPIAGDEA
jgi:hypothetical protein